jgi:hypothetical protein
MASVKDVEKVADELEGLVGQLRSEVQNGPDFERLIEIADSISERADLAASTFNTVNEALMGRINEISSGSGNSGNSGSGSSRRSKSKSS